MPGRFFMHCPYLKADVISWIFAGGRGSCEVIGLALPNADGLMSSKWHCLSCTAYHARGYGQMVSGCNM